MSTPTMPSRASTLLFLHIPKTAGTTFNAILDRNFAAAETYFVDPNETRESVEAFKQFSSAERATFRLVRGHMAFGLHAFVPGASTYITMLRDPLDRAISLYYFAHSLKKHYLHRAVTEQELDLGGLIASGISLEFDNGQTRLIAGAGGWYDDVPFGQCTQEMLDVAIRNIDEHFSVAGLVERFDETVLLLGRRFGWPYRSMLYRRQNETPNRVPVSALPTEVSEIVRWHHALDIQLYEHVHSVLERQLKRELQRTEEEVENFVRWNRLYNRLDSSVRRAKSLLPRRARTLLPR